MTRLNLLLLAPLFAVLASVSTATNASNCADDNTPRWVHESEAFESCPPTKTSEHTARSEAAAEAKVPADARHAAPKVARSPFRDDTAA